jgi:hypothetical protein
MLEPILHPGCRAWDPETRRCGVLLRRVGLIFASVACTVICLSSCTSARPSSVDRCVSPGTSVGPGTTPAPVVKVSGSLSRPPDNCGGPVPREVAPFFGPAIGKSQLFAVGFTGKQATLHVRNGPRTSFGWRVKVLLLLSPDVTAPVGLRGDGTKSGAPIWIAPGDSAPATNVLLDPEHPAIPVQHGQWKEFPSYFYIPATGCYALEATLSSGAWTVPFAAGR